MNFLQLCNRVKTEAGISGNDFSSVSNAYGELSRVVSWTRDAYLSLQNERRWMWLWRRMDANLIAGTRTINPAVTYSVFALEWDQNTFLIRRLDRDLSDQSKLDFMRYANRPQIGLVAEQRPSEIVLMPDRTLQFNTTLDTDYNLQADYYSTSETLALDADTPSLPEQYHLAIAWRAVMMYAQYEEATQLYQLANASYQQLYGQMTNTELQGDFGVGALA